MGLAQARPNYRGITKKVVTEALNTQNISGAISLSQSDIPYSSKFLRSNNFVIFVRCKLITKFLSTKIFTPMGVSIGAAMNHEKCCL